MKQKLFAYAVMVIGVVAAFAIRVDAHPGLHHEIEAVSRKLALAPDRVDLLLERGRLHRLDDDPVAALDDLRLAQALDPSGMGIALELGLTLSTLGLDVAAEEELSRHIEGGEGFPDAYAGRARLRARGGRFDAAIRDYSAALLRSDDLDLYLARGSLQEELGRLDDAAEGYRRGLARMNGAVSLRLPLIRVEVGRQRYDAALALIDQVLPDAAVKTQWYLRRADVLDAAGRADESRVQREEALAEADRILRRRTTAINLVGRARAYVALGRLDEARQDLLDALDKAPHFDAARTLLEQLGRPSAENGGPGR